MPGFFRRILLFRKEGGRWRLPGVESVITEQAGNWRLTYVMCRLTLALLLANISRGGRQEITKSTVRSQKLISS